MRYVATFQSPDGESIIAICANTRGNRDSFLIARLNLSGELVNTIARRTTEEQARKRANLTWLQDKFGEAEALRRYTQMYPSG